MPDGAHVDEVAMYSILEGNVMREGVAGPPKICYEARRGSQRNAHGRFEMVTALASFVNIVRREPLPFVRRAEHTMAMPAAERRWWTAADVRKLIDETRHWPRYEVVAGELLVTPAPAPRHQVALAWLYNGLLPYVQRENLGTLLWSPADIELAPDELTQPDLFILPQQPPPARWSEITQLSLAIEASSPSTARYDRTVKRPYYQRAGVPEYWIIDLDAQLVERWRPNDERPEILVRELEWHPGGASSPLVLPLGDLWNALPAD